MDNIPILNSIKRIERQYNTGETPVLVVCSDKESYVCKYMRSSSASYKLVSEFIGAQFVSEWNLESPIMALVRIRPEHWADIVKTTRNLSAPALGYKYMNGVIDINPTTYSSVSQSETLLFQLLKIALFDFWIANEDRTYNNANLLYDVSNEKLVSIDYGGILNTSTYEYSLSQLTSTDTILYADLFRHLSKGINLCDIQKKVCLLKEYFEESINKCNLKIQKMIDAIPVEWNVSKKQVEDKLTQLFDEDWVKEVWNNFNECLKENFENG